MMMVVEVVDPVLKPGPFEMYKADSGALRFQLRLPMGSGTVNFSLLAREHPNKEVYQFILGERSRFVDVTKDYEEGMKIFLLPEPINALYKDFWLTWYNGEICLGSEGQCFFKYADQKITTNNIGFVKFCTISSTYGPVDWLYESPPVVINGIISKEFEDGALRWKEMTSDHLPQDAFIGGFENEPIYIARARHNGSLCPGKYVPSKRLAFVPWGGREHSKSNFEILCGYNAKWVKTSGNRIPQNAFTAGTSERRNEPLYIGRNLLENNLINGKVQAHWGLCYLPYKGKEVEVGHFEILVSPLKTSRGIEYIQQD